MFLAPVSDTRRTPDGLALTVILVATVGLLFPLHGRASSHAGKTDSQAELRSPSAPADTVRDVVRAFQEVTSVKNLSAIEEILDAKLSNWEAYDSEPISAILEAIGKNQVRSLQPYLIAYARSYPEHKSSLLPASAAIRSLGRLGGEKAFRELARLRKDAPTSLLDTVAVALGMLNDRRSVAELEPLAKHQDRKVRARAISSLASYCEDSSYQMVVDALDDESNRVRNSATWWLSRCGTLADVEYLERRLLDSDSVVRQNAIRGLIRLGSKEGCKYVDALKKDESKTVQLAAREYSQECAD